MKRFIHHRTSKYTSKIVFLMCIFSLSFILTGGIKAIYRVNKGNIESNRVYKNPNHFMISPQENDLDSLDDERNLFIKPAWTTDSETAAAFYTIQVGAFLNPHYARSTLKHLKDNAHFPVVISTFPSTQGIWHRVHVGAFKSRSQAESYLSRLEKDYHGSYVIKMQH